MLSSFSCGSFVIGNAGAFEWKLSTLSAQVGDEHYVAMRRSLLRPTDGGFQQVSDPRRDLTPEVLRHLITIGASLDEKKIAAALTAIGAPHPLHSDPQALLRAACRWSLVSAGPAAASMWKQAAGVPVTCLSVAVFGSLVDPGQFLHVYPSVLLF